MCVITISSSEDVKLVALGDTHIGHRDADLNLLGKAIEWIKENGAYVVLMGDLIDTRVEGYPGANDSETTQDQLERFFEYFDEIRDNIVGMIAGNHEYRVWKKAGIDVTKMMAHMIGRVPTGTRLMIRVQTGRNEYKVYAVHGGGMASTPTGKLNKAIRMFTWVDADVILYGHTHMLHWLEIPRIGIDGEYTLSDGLKVRKRYAVMTGSYLAYPDYVSMRGGMPTALGSPVLVFSHDEWGVSIFSIP